MGIAMRDSSDANVDSPFNKRFGLLYGSQLYELYLDIRSLLAKLANQVWQPAVQGRRHKPDVKNRALIQPDPPRRNLHLLDVSQYLQRLFIENSPGVGEANGSALANEQLDAQFVFQSLNLPAERRLSDMQLLR